MGHKNQRQNIKKNDDGTTTNNSSTHINNDIPHYMLIPITQYNPDSDYSKYDTHASNLSQQPNNSACCQTNPDGNGSSNGTQFLKRIELETIMIEKLSKNQIKTLLCSIVRAIQILKDTQKKGNNFNLKAEGVEACFIQQICSQFHAKQVAKLQKILLVQNLFQKLQNKSLQEIYLYLHAQLKILQIDSTNLECAQQQNNCLQNNKAHTQIVAISASQPQKLITEQQTEDCKKEQDKECCTSNQAVEDINQLQQNLCNRLDNPDFIDDLCDCSTQDSELGVDKTCKQFQHIAKNRPLTDKSSHKANVMKFKQFNAKIREHKIVEDAYIVKITGNLLKIYSDRINTQVIGPCYSQIFQKKFRTAETYIKIVQSFIFLDQQFDFKSYILTKQQMKHLRRSAMIVKNKILPSIEEDDKDKQNDGLNEFIKPIADEVQKFISSDDNIFGQSIHDKVQILKQKFKEFNRLGEQRRSQVEQKKQRLKIGRQALNQQSQQKTKKNIERLRIEVVKKDLYKLLEISQSLALAEMGQDEQPKSQCLPDKSMEAQPESVEAQTECQEVKNKSMETQLKLQKRKLNVKKQRIRVCRHSLEAQTECQEVKDKSMQAQPESVEAQTECQEVKDKSMQAQPESVEAQTECQEVKNKSMEAQPESVQAQTECQEVKNKSMEAQPKSVEAQTECQEVKNKSMEAQPESVQAQTECQEVNNKSMEAQPESVEAQTECQEVKNKSMEAQPESVEAQTECQEVKNKSMEAQPESVQAQTECQEVKNKSMEAQPESVEAQTECQEVKNKSMEAQPESVEAQTECQEVKDKSMQAQPESVEAIKIQIMQQQNINKNNTESLEACINVELFDPQIEKKKKEKQSGLAQIKANKGCKKDDRIKYNQLVHQNNKNKLFKNLDEKRISSKLLNEQYSQMVQRIKLYEFANKIIKVQKQVEIDLEQPKFTLYYDKGCKLISNTKQQNSKLGPRHHASHQQHNPIILHNLFKYLCFCLCLCFCLFLIYGFFYKSWDVYIMQWKSRFMGQVGKQSIEGSVCRQQFEYNSWRFDKIVVWTKKSVDYIVKLILFDSEITLTGISFKFLYLDHFQMQRMLRLCLN